MAAADGQLSPGHGDGGPGRSELHVADMVEGDEVGPMRADESGLGPLLLEIGQGHADEVAGIGRVEPGVIALGLDVRDVVAPDHPGGAAEVHRDHFRCRGSVLHEFTDAAHRPGKALGAHWLQQVVHGGELEGFQRALFVRGHEDNRRGVAAS
ncbi:hypothetical protein D9M72_458950 [compost metagenome]